MNMLRTMTVALAFGMSAAALAEEVRFVTCPIYRDTDSGRRTGCWLADNPATGTRYEVNESWSKPDWNFAVLVEGKVDESIPDTCGGITLNPVRTSVLYDMKCPHHRLPAEGYTGRKPTFSDRYVMPLSEERELPPKPYKTTTFSPTFDFNSAFITWNLSDYAVDQAIAFIKAADPEKVVVTGWADTRSVEISGVTLSEPAELAQERADVVVTNLLGMEVPEDLIEVRAKTDAQPSDTPYADGLTEPSRRRVDIKVVVD